MEASSVVSEKKKRTFQYVSCLTIERVPFQITSLPKLADNLIVVGNVGNFYTSTACIDIFLDYVCKIYEHVFFVPGPLEYEGGPMDLGNEVCDSLVSEMFSFSPSQESEEGRGDKLSVHPKRKERRRKNNLHVLPSIPKESRGGSPDPLSFDPSLLDVPSNSSTFLFPKEKIRIIGARLWGCDPEIYKSRGICLTKEHAKQSPPLLIGKKEAIKLNKKDVESLRQEVQKAKERKETVIVVTHGCPTHKLWAGQNESPYIVDGSAPEELITGPLAPNYWIYGAPGTFPTVTLSYGSEESMPLHGFFGPPCSYGSRKVPKGSREVPRDPGKQKERTTTQFCVNNYNSQRLVFRDENVISI